MTDPKFASPIPTYLNKQTVEGVASAVAKHFNFGIGDPVEVIVSGLGGELEYGWNSLDEVEGGSIVARSFHNFTIFISDLTSPKRDRFTMANELGHLFLHLPKLQEKQQSAVMRATRKIDKSDEIQQRAEWEANWFAAQLLMPRAEFKDCVSTFGLDHASRVFNVSQQAASVRYSSILVEI